MLNSYFIAVYYKRLQGLLPQSKSYIIMKVSQFFVQQSNENRQSKNLEIIFKDRGCN